MTAKAVTKEKAGVAKNVVLPIDVLVASDDNCHRTINQAALRSLAQSIRRDGILQPLVVRPHPRKKNRYEIRAGERRWRAARLAGLKEVPVVIRKLDDQGALAVTIAENLQRENLHPLEEAVMIQQALDREYDLKILAAKLGKPLKYLHRRAALTELSDSWRKLIGESNSDAGRLSAAHLELIARLPAVTQEMLATDRGHAVFGRGFPTVAELGRMIDASLHSLTAMPWALDDETLDPQAGPCLNCEKRSGRQPMLFADETPSANGRPSKTDRCLDPACFDRKNAAHLLRSEAAIRTKHDNLRLVQIGMPALGEAVHSAFGDRITRLYYPRIVKAGTDGAVPAMPVDGPKAGRLVFLAPDESPSASGRQPNGKKTVPSTLAERRERLQTRRRAFVVKKVEERLRELEREPGRIPSDAEFDPVAMLTTFGNGRVADCALDDAWVNYDRMRQAPTEGRNEHVIRAVLPVWLRRLIVRDKSQLDAQLAEAKRVSEVLRIEVGVFEAEAVEAIPEPKAWASIQEVDNKTNGRVGTPRRSRSKRSRRR